MRRVLMGVAVVLSLASFSVAQNPAVSQTARQALLEMFFGKPGSFEKHLPAVTKAAIHKANPDSGPSMLQIFSLMSSQMSSAPGQHFETFDSGSTLLRAENSTTQSKFEITVDSDDLRGDEDSIELSFKAYKEGQEQARGVLPRLTMVMKQEGEKPEAQIWTLNEITFSIRVPLADPDFLKGIAEGMKQSRASSTPVAGNSTFVPANTAGAVNAMRAIMAAETTYAATYTGHGFTCSLSDLDGFGGDQPNEHQAMLIESRLASGKKYGYSFNLSGCSAAPAQSYKLTAVPSTPGGGRAYCSDQTSVMRYSDDGSAANCLQSGKVLP